MPVTMQGNKVTLLNELMVFVMSDSRGCCRPLSTSAVPLSPRVTHEHKSKQMKQNVFTSRVFTFDEFQRHRPSSPVRLRKQKYHLFNLRPLSLLMSPLMSLLPPCALAPLL